MRRTQTILLSWGMLALAWACSSPPNAPAEAPAPGPRAASALPASYPQKPIQKEFPGGIQRGVCYAHAWDDAVDGGYGSPADATTLKRLREHGVEWVSLTPFAFQRQKNSAGISGTTANYKHAESDERIAASAKTAHELGIKVLLKPHVWVGDSSWCGAIQPPDWDAWVDSYAPVVEHYAKLAAEIRADGYLIGNELGTATKARPEKFRELIALARKHYDGPISYAANWDEAARIPFWDDLDAIGVNAYWPLTKNKDADEEEMYKGALKIEAHLSELASKTGRPILLTEIGFRSVAGSAVDPNTWPEHDRGRKVDFAAQEKAYRAVLRAFWGRPYLRGFYFWKVISDGSWREDGGEAGFSPIDKPAGKVMREYYTGK